MGSTGSKWLPTLFAIFVMLGLSACANLPFFAEHFCPVSDQPPPPEPLGPQSAAIGISLILRVPAKIFSVCPESVYFIRLYEADENQGLRAQTRLIPPNYAKGKQVYLLNAEPGRYAAVHTSAAHSPKQLITLSEVSVAPGTIAFMGDYVVDMSPLEDADSLRAANLSKEAEQRFLANARKHLQLTDWLNIIQKRLQELKTQK